MDLAELAARIRALYPAARIVAALDAPPPADFTRYRNDPVNFMRDVLGVTPTGDQAAIAGQAARGGRIKVNSGHGVGKSHLAACLALWWFYTRPNSVVVTTAPTERDVIFILWTEIRLLVRKARLPLIPYFVGPRAPEMFDNEEHWAKGYTARRGESFQGRHRESMLFIFDESEGLEPVFWETTGTMYQPDADHCWLAIGNPTTTSSQSYLEDLAVGADGGPKWRIYTLSALNHPNVRAQLAGRPPPVPNAVTLGQVEQWLRDWTDRVEPQDRRATDVEWPPGSGAYYRPGPSFLSRVMGIRPTTGVDTVWSEAAWVRAVSPAVPSGERLRNAWAARAGVTIGVDPALFGDDDTAYHVRIGPVSVHHESHNGWSQDKSAGRLKELCNEWAAFYDGLAFVDRPRLSPHDVRATIEGDGGFGAGVHSHRGDYRGWKLANAGGGSDIFVNGRPVYANMRSQWWCETAKTAEGGGADLSRLPADVKAKLRMQLLTPCYWQLPSGARMVEPKDQIKGRLKRSPDDADAFILSHHTVKSYSPSVVSVGDEMD